MSVSATYRRPLVRAAAFGAAALALWLGWEVWYIVGGSNLREVIPGKVYRGAQPSPASLERLIKKYGIRTVLNLRGCVQPEQWYLNEARVCHDQGVSQEDVGLSAIHFPSRHEIRHLVEVLERTEYPIFLHCRQGVDRTGLVAAFVLLLHTDTPYDVARRQMSLRNGHLSFGRTSYLDKFLALYEGWLRDTHQDHAPSVLRHWLLNEYRGGLCDARIEEVVRLTGPMKLGVPIAFRVGVRNLSDVPWQFSPTPVAGIHLYYKLYDDDGYQIDEGRAGLVERTVGPGERTDLTLVLPLFSMPGRYRLLIDFLEENHCWFGQTGTEPWEEELDVRE